MSIDTGEIPAPLPTYDNAAIEDWVKNGCPAGEKGKQEFLAKYHGLLTTLEQRAPRYRGRQHTRLRDDNIIILPEIGRLFNSTIGIDLPADIPLDCLIMPEFSTNPADNIKGGGNSVNTFGNKFNKALSSAMAHEVKTVGELRVADYSKIFPSPSTYNGMKPFTEILFTTSPPFQPSIQAHE